MTSSCISKLDFIDDSIDPSCYWGQVKVSAVRRILKGEYSYSAKKFLRAYRVYRQYRWDNPVSKSSSQPTFRYKLVNIFTNTSVVGSTYGASLDDFVIFCVLPLLKAFRDSAVNLYGGDREPGSAEAYFKRVGDPHNEFKRFIF